MVDDGNAVDILYLNAYKRMGLTRRLGPQQLPILWLHGDHVVPKGVEKLIITIGEHPQTSTVLDNFFVVDALSAINRIIARPLLKALKMANSIYHLTMKFLTAEGTCKVQGNQYDSRECYNKSSRIAEKDNRSLMASLGKTVASSSKRSGVTEQAYA